MCSTQSLLVRLPDGLVGRLRFYCVSSSFLFLSSFFVSYPPSLLNGTQLKSATCSKVSTIWKCMSEIWGITSP